MTNDIIEVIQERLKMLHEHELLCADECRVLRLLVEEIKQQYIKLPLDADGVPIRPGDNVKATINNFGGSVALITESDITLRGDKGLTYSACSFVHVKPDKVENLLKELASEFCAPLTHEDDDIKNIITEYAEKIKAALDNGECKLVYGENDHGDDGWWCQSCGEWFAASFRHTGRNNIIKPSYCQHCGCKIQKEAEQ